MLKGRDGDCWKDLNVLPPQKRVSFAERHQVVLHISRKELAEERERIWYSKLNFGVFRNEAINEMRSYMRLHGIVSPDEALVCLYQPQPVIAAAVVGRVNSMS